MHRSWIISCCDNIAKWNRRQKSRQTVRRQSSPGLPLPPLQLYRGKLTPLTTFFLLSFFLSFFLSSILSLFFPSFIFLFLLNHKKIFLENLRRRLHRLQYSCERNIELHLTQNVLIHVLIQLVHDNTSYLNATDAAIVEVILFLSEVKWVSVKFLGIKMPCTLGWLYTEGNLLYFNYFIWCVSCTVVVLTYFVMCVCFGNMCTCIYCVLYCLYCVCCIVSFMYIYSYLFCLYWCKDYCHRVTPQLHLVVVVVIMPVPVAVRSKA